MFINNNKIPTTYKLQGFLNVGVDGFEPPTLCL